MTFYSYIFPNTALTSATFSVGRALNNRAINIVGCVMTCLLILAWFAVFGMMIRAVIVKDILWPQKQEDRAEGGWKASPDERVPYPVPVPAPPHTPAPEPAERVDSGADGANGVVGKRDDGDGGGKMNGGEVEGMRSVMADRVADQRMGNGMLSPKRAEDLV